MFTGVGWNSVTKFIAVIQKRLTPPVVLKLCDFPFLHIGHLLKEFQLNNLTRGLMSL